MNLETQKGSGTFTLQKSIFKIVNFINAITY